MHPITIDTLAAFPLQLEAHFAAIPAEFRHWTPASWEGVPSEPFTAIEQICHVRDIEIDGYQLRFRRTLDEVDPLLVSIDSDALASERGYAAANPVTVFTAFRAARAKTVELLSNLNPEQFKRSAEFEGYGPVTLRGLVHHLCSHDQQHLAGLQWLLGKIETARR
ncbi:DinB family protein [Collimonas antrihumi]|uniref:DinB family protein n=1 Tax=Collimonas antrihumi TaxID=1940615 RepID=UPI001B8C05E0|nr:DinB family protein [Collimonas antrihumi]